MMHNAPNDHYSKPAFRLKLVSIETRGTGKKKRQFATLDLYNSEDVYESRIVLMVNDKLDLSYRVGVPRLSVFSQVVEFLQTLNFKKE